MPATSGSFDRFGALPPVDAPFLAPPFLTEMAAARSSDGVGSICRVASSPPGRADSPMAGVASFGTDQPSMRRPHRAQNEAFSGSSALQCGQRTKADIGWRDRSMLRYDMTMNQILDHVLGAARQLGASDVHLKAGLPPVFRIKGDLRTLRDTPPLTAEVIATFAVNLMSDRQRDIFEKHHDADLSYGTPDGVRYRVNVFKQRGQTGMVLRIIPPDVPGFDKLNLPPAVGELCKEERGLILVTGITGSGKSTTLAAMIDFINRQRANHIVTVEDPIEFLHKDRPSVVNQREIGFDATSFSTALRAALRQDPDVILVGEMRDEETIETALHASET